jgi:hypothetical protein
MNKFINFVRTNKNEAEKMNKKHSKKKNLIWNKITKNIKAFSNYPFVK